MVIRTACRWHVQAGDDDDDDEGDDEDTQTAIQSPTADAAAEDDHVNDERHADNAKRLDNDVVTQSPDSYSSHNDDGKPHSRSVLIVTATK